MGYIGTKPSAVPLTSADIADGIITSAKIVDATIANADIANSTIDLTAKVTGTLPTTKGGTGLAALGTVGQALVVNSGATALEYATVGAAAGQVIQVVTATDSTVRSGTSSTFSLNSSTLSLSITPSAAANKIYITLSTTVEIDGTNLQGKLTIFRDSTDLGAASNLGLGSYYGGYAPDGSSAADNITCAILDSPNTTSSITYQIRFRNTNNSSPIYINKYGMKGSITAFEIKG